MIQFNNYLSLCYIKREKVDDLITTKDLDELFAKVEIKDDYFHDLINSVLDQLKNEPKKFEQMKERRELTVY